MEAFIAFIGLWPVSWAPKYWSFCWGQLISLSQNPSLYSLIGVNYGGDGRNNFGLPDFRGRVPVGAGVGPGLASYQLGMKYGFERIVLNEAQMPSHNHQATIDGLEIQFMASTLAGTESTPGANNATTIGATKKAMGAGDMLYNTENPTVALNGVSIEGGDILISNSGDDQYVENRQPFNTVNYIICMDGVYPQRQ
ncbi:phage tail protein [Ancylomarina euxinus]|uniref:Phage tail protein n=1 Tax=Ancylomarina euxinus TaxID=2283627 RepID=A0A425Y5L8_9BACT|nr:tail fiber protein [Ancylomarina euxinus]MCZ4694167.1 tail fiber protein [Ancylomarina euxinus]MUP14502.1 phage tail protein [Ancylomarina euxinus]RRG23803.1 phage tail protein [Ancylomarina euxinus]